MPCVASISTVSPCRHPPSFPVACTMSPCRLHRHHVSVSPSGHVILLPALCRPFASTDTMPPCHYLVLFSCRLYHITVSPPCFVAVSPSSLVFLSPAPSHLHRHHVTVLPPPTSCHHLASTDAVSPPGLVVCRLHRVAVLPPACEDTKNKQKQSVDGDNKSRYIWRCVDQSTTDFFACCVT